MGRALVVLLLLCVTLPCYVWYAVQQVVVVYPPGQRGAAIPMLLQPAPPYQLLNESEPAPMEELAALTEDDATRLMDIRDFRWLLGGEADAVSTRCVRGSGSAPLILVLVHTATDHAEYRHLIRETWGSWSRDVLVRFLVGQPAGHDDVQQRALEREAADFGDVVQGSFVDAYRNMTYKHAMALKWFATRCPEATYVLKVDDDVMVNTPVLLDFVRRSLSPFGARRLLACNVLKRALPKRTWRSKWRVSWREYERWMYPTYCAGWAVLYSPDVALQLYREVQREPYFWIDDVLVTGMIPERLGLTHVSWESMLMAPGDVSRVVSGLQRPSFMLALWYDVDMDMQSQRLVWQRVLEDAADYNPVTLL